MRKNFFVQLINSDMLTLTCESVVLCVAPDIERRGARVTRVTHGGHWSRVHTRPLNSNSWCVASGEKVVS